MVIHTLLKVPGAVAAAPADAAHDGGSPRDTLTVPILELCIDVLPPPQLMMIRETTATREPSKIEIG